MKGGDTVAQAKKLAATSEYPRAMDPDARNDQLIALATDLAEQQLRAGTASSQVITHYLKLGSPTARLEKQKLEQEVKLAAAKTEALQSAKRIEELYGKALAAMKIYGGQTTEEDV